jgi:hypothetical protein
MKFDFPDDVKWLDHRTILLAVTGSTAYGTNTPTSDKDYKGVCIPPEDYYYGLHTFNDYNTTGSKNWKNTKDDVDVSIMHVNKFVMDCMAGVPNNIEILFTNPEHILKCNYFGKILIKNRRDFLSKALKKKFGGYANGQVALLKTKKSNGTGRVDLIEKYGYDTKFGSHAVRLLTSAIDILETGNFTTYRPNRQELLNIRNGKFTLDELLLYIEKLDREMQEACEKCKVLPELPDYDKINKWLIELNKEAMEKMW